LKKLAKIKRVGLIANPEKASGRLEVRRAAKFIETQGLSVLTEPGTAQFVGLKTPVCPNARALAAKTDLILVLEATAQCCGWPAKPPVV
jgi:hypothetical protein